jgi:hypothetical protein
MIARAPCLVTVTLLMLPGAMAASAEKTGPLMLNLEVGPAFRVYPSSNYHDTGLIQDDGVTMGVVAPELGIAVTRARNLYVIVAAPVQFRERYALFGISIPSSRSDISPSSTTRATARAAASWSSATAPSSRPRSASSGWRAAAGTSGSSPAWRSRSCATCACTCARSPASA